MLERIWLAMNSVQFSRSVVSDSLWPHGPQHARPPCPSPTPGVYSDSCPSRQWCHPTISSSVVPFSSCLQSFPASGSFQMSQLFASGGQSIGISASTSVLPMNIQDWFPLGWTGWISLQSKGLPRVFSSTTVQNQFFCAQLSLWSNSHVHTRPLEKPGMLRFILFSQPFRVLLRCFKCSIQNLSQDWNFDSYFLSLLSSQTRYWISKDEPYIVWSFI